MCSVSYWPNGNGSQIVEGSAGHGALRRYEIAREKNDFEMAPLNYINF